MDWILFLEIWFLPIPILFILSHIPNESSAIRFYARYLFFYYVTSTIGIFYIPFVIIRAKNVDNCRVISGTLSIISPLLRIKFEMRNPEILEEERGCVVISNHQSSLDILGMFTNWHHFEKCATIAKKSLLYAFPFGPVCYLSGVVFINRSNSKSAYKNLEITSKLMVEKKMKIWIYPEGTRNKQEDPMLAFKRGAFVTAVNAQVPIIPVVFSPYYFINQRKHFWQNNGRVVIEALEPVPTKGLTPDDIPELIETIRNKMVERYEQLTKELTHDLDNDYPGLIPSFK